MDFNWLNKSELTETDGKITIYAPAETDFFCNDGTVGSVGLRLPTMPTAPDSLSQRGSPVQ